METKRYQIWSGEFDENGKRTYLTFTVSFVNRSSMLAFERDTELRNTEFLHQQKLKRKPRK